MVDIIINLLPSPIESLPYELKSVVSFIYSGQEGWPTVSQFDGRYIRKDLLVVMRMGWDWAELAEVLLYKIIYISNTKALQLFANFKVKDRRYIYVQYLSFDMHSLTPTDIVNLHVVFPRLKNLGSISINSDYAAWDVVRPALVHLKSLKSFKFTLNRSIVYQDEYEEDYGEDHESLEDGVVTIADLPNLVNLEKIIYHSDSSSIRGFGYGYDEIEIQNDMKVLFGPSIRTALVELDFRAATSSELAFLFPLSQSLKVLRINHCNEKHSNFLSTLSPTITKLQLAYTRTLKDQFIALYNDPGSIPCLRNLWLEGFDGHDLPVLPSTIRTLRLSYPIGDDHLVSALERLESTNLEVLIVDFENEDFDFEEYEEDQQELNEVNEVDWERIVIECERLEVELERID